MLDKVFGSFLFLIFTYCQGIHLLNSLLARRTACVGSFEYEGDSLCIIAVGRITPNERRSTSAASTVVKRFANFFFNVV